MDQRAASVTVVVVAPAEQVDVLDGALAGEGTNLVAVTDAADAVSCLAQGMPDVVVTTTGADELAAAAAISRATPGIRIVAVGEADPAALVAAGVGAVVATDEVGSHLAMAVISLAHGVARLDAPLARYLVERAGDDPAGEPLSATEEEVLGRLGAGDGVDELAEAYAVSPRMVGLVAGGVIARAIRDAPS
jgi:DNA-binding NarL/FixJ family response regulator